MKLLGLSLFVFLILTGCSPRIGIGVGGVAISPEGSVASNIHADSQTGVHGSVAMGTDMRL